MPARTRSEGWWDNLVGPGKPLDTDRFFVIGVNNPGSCFGSTGPMQPEPRRRRPALRRRLPGRHGRGLGRCPGPAARRARHRTAGGGDRRQPGRHAGAAGRCATRSACATASRSPRRPTCRRRTSPSTRWRGARSSPTPTSTAATSTDHGVLPRRGLRVARMIGHITYLSDDAMEAKFGRDAAERPRSATATQDDRVPDRELPAPPGRQVQRVLRRQHLPADHARARLLRPGARPRRRPRGDLRRGALPLPAGQLHHRLALRPGALARDRQGAGRQPARRQLRRDRRAARPRRLPARRPALPRRAAGLLRQPRQGARERRLGHRCAAAARAAIKRSPCATASTMSDRKDIELIAELVPRGSRVLDLGCGNGELLALLQRPSAAAAATASRSTTPTCWPATQRGVNVIQLNLEEGLALFEDAELRRRAAARHAAAPAQHRDHAARDRARRPHRHRQLSELRALAEPAACRRRPHAGDARAALPVVRHAEHPRRHLCRLRGAGAQGRPAHPRRVRHPGRAAVVRNWPNLLASVAVFKFERG